MQITPADISFDDAGNARSETYGDIYYNPGRATDKTTHIFHRATHLPERLAALPADGVFTVGEIGFGLALNFLGTWDLMRKAAPGRRLRYVGIDAAPPTREQLQQALAPFPQWRELTEQLVDHWPERVAGVHRLELPGVSLTLHLGDVRDAVRGLTGHMDAWFLDGFAPEKNPDMWSGDLFKQLAKHTRPGGCVGSFTSAGHVRRALADAGFAVERLDGTPLKRHILSATLPGEYAPQRAPRKRIAILGAGWAGLLAADALLQRGHEVRLIDAQEPGAGASGIAQAVCAPVFVADTSPRQDWYRSAFVLASRRHARTGVLRHVDPQTSDATLTKIIDAFGSLDPLFERRDDARAVWMPTAGQALFHETAKPILETLPATNKHWPCEITSLDHDTGSWRLTSAIGETLEADIVLLTCAGAVRRFAPTADWPLQLIRGQTTHVRATQASQQHTHITAGSAYVCPAIDGYHTVGATFDRDDADLNTRAEDDADNRRRAMETAPRWAEQMDWSDTRSRTGLRCGSPDFLPMVGPVPDIAGCADAWQRQVPRDWPLTAPAYPGLYAAAAFGSHGVISTALAAPLLADELESAPLPCCAAAHAAVTPARYLARAAKREQPVAFPASK